MQVAVLVPGIMATRLVLPASGGSDDEEVWPPTPFETKFGYKRIDKLQDDRVKPSALIYDVLCFSFYSTIRDRLAELGFRPGGTDKAFVDFPYDWRQDNFDTADLLAAKLAELHANGATEIHICAHSMGGLVTRLVLESGKFDNQPWFGAVKTFIALAVPHLGAPLALARIFGIDSTLGISGKDFATLASNRKYPSGYQLIPAPGEQAVWDLSSPDLKALDPYHRHTSTQLGMVPELVEKARAVHDVLGKNNKPDDVRYFYFAGVGHSTATRVNVKLGSNTLVNHDHSIVTRTPDGGDGTVPIYSALPDLGQRQLVVNEHATVFKGRPFKRVFFRLLGGDAGPPIEAAEAEGEPLMALSIDSPVQRVGEPIELSMAMFRPGADPKEGDVNEATVEKIEGKLVLDLVDEDGRIAERGHRTSPVSYSGPALHRLTVNLPPIAKPGLFLLRFSGTPTADDDVRFAVSEA